MPHALAAHTATPLAGAAQALLQAPQFFRLLRVSKHWPEHAVSPVLHCTPQPATPHTARPYSGVAQLVVQLPQCAGSAPRSTQLFSQRAVPAGQLLTHFPPEQP
jgi:hypothetical protein